MFSSQRRTKLFLLVNAGVSACPVKDWLVYSFDSVRTVLYARRNEHDRTLFQGDPFIIDHDADQSIQRLGVFRVGSCKSEVLVEVVSVGISFRIAWSAIPAH